jgi:glycosyltransferase involved in cell wall biosynthesis
MACGKPLVVTDVGGLKELVYQDETDGGYKVKPDSEAIADACLKILENAALRSKLEANSRDRALRYYQFDRWEADLKDFFQTVVDESPIPTWEG